MMDLPARWQGCCPRCAAIYSATRLPPASATSKPQGKHGAQLEARAQRMKTVHSFRRHAYQILGFVYGT
eukprot:COSAG03_NODE_1018_length_5011_cov_2.960505_4_plen_69_part_00